ncbi:5241e8b6-4c04-44f3-836d-f05955b87a4f [Sclerotinia trifoliorum]|uniref:5241e8b6-4c04-44f3-836d-f05955b87a4f n=1 Tax=Sclerotinia trifoliorum TaxID=28548 RepID=A0A8H2W2K9_9HELO|nr:5241e8b6-4c04-44f3-836d-f05955b87a4f [Sclerotinia trifoliorum]
MKITPFVLLSLTSLLPLTNAWGTLGHQTVAYVATNFVAEDTRGYFQMLLRNDTGSYLAGVATWADSYRYTKAGNNTGPWHFIDALDDVPRSCGVKFARDCGEEGCVVGAILNFTSQLLDPNVSRYHKYIAAKFIVHFVGDIHQPLHAENIDIGGNTIKVTFNGKETNLHSFWDTAIPEELVGGYSITDAQKWANVLTTAIKTGKYKYQAKSWLEGMNIGDPLTTALGWARDSNAFICTTVMPDGAEVLQGMELSGEYYESGVPVVELQVARAGYRLAAWLDMIVGGIKTEL